MRRLLWASSSVFALCLLLGPVAALAAEEEPYSGGEITQTTLSPAITVAADGLAVTFRARSVSGDCTWEFGDGTTGTGNPVEHSYTSDGAYDIRATCGAVVLNRTVTFAAELAFTGFSVATFGLLGLVLLLMGAGTLWLTRRARANS